RLAAAFRPGGRRGATMDARDELLRRARAADAPADGAEGTEEDTDEPPPVNIIDAASPGAADGLSLAVIVGAMLLAVRSVSALGNAVLGAVGGLIGDADLTVQAVLGYVFAPVMTAVGVPVHEAVDAGGFLGQKVIVNELAAFSDFAPRA